MPLTLWLGLAALAILWLKWLRRRYVRLAQFPGPVLASFSDLWQLWFMYRDVNHEPYRSLHKRYGPVVRMAPNKLYFSRPQAARDIFSTRADLSKSDYYTVSAPVADGRPVTNMFATTDAKYHDLIRRVVQPAFNKASIEPYEPAIDRVVAELLLQWRQRFAGKKDEEGVVDLARWCHYFAVDAIGNVTYSEPYGCLERDQDVRGIIRDIEADLTYQTYVSRSQIATSQGQVTIFR